MVALIALPTSKDNLARGSNTGTSGAWEWLNNPCIGKRQNVESQKAGQLIDYKEMSKVESSRLSTFSTSEAHIYCKSLIVCINRQCRMSKVVKNRLSTPENVETGKPLQLIDNKAMSKMSKNVESRISTPPTPPQRARARAYTREAALGRLSRFAQNRVPWTWRYRWGEVLWWWSLRPWRKP